MKSKQLRVRRSSEEAREAILGAAEEQFLEGGIEGLRLVEIAEAAGMTHPTLLHHFGSRDGLVEALVTRVTDRLQHDLIRILAEQAPAPGRGDRTVAMFTRSAEILEDQGFARLAAWLLLAGRDPQQVARGLMVPLVQATHAVRTARCRQEGRPDPSFEETRSVSLMFGIMVFGEALFGPAVRASVGLDETPEVKADFWRWFAQFLEAYQPPDT